MEKAVAASTLNLIHTNHLDDEKSTMTDSISTVDTSSRAPRAANNQNDAVAAADDGVRVLQIHEYKPAALALAEAFAEDDVAMYFINTPDRQHWTAAQKWELHLAILEYVVYAHILKGLALTVGEDYGCVALWMPPGRNMDDQLTVIRSGMWRLHFQLSKEGKKRFFEEFLPLLHDTKARTMGARDDDSWYLVYLGTKKASQGQGLAKKLVKKVTDLADAQNKACYLESSNAKNPAIYQRWGFEVARRVHLQRGPNNVDLDIMVREPNQSAARVEREKAKTDEEIRDIVEANLACRPC
ncbi:MAG: hypothetical protein M1821_000578 [Bathelium mastoideum]|nr:MAG: hypothetical protein M1821_000578 [Bathelium mastoideum]KAI9683045.1 MAG: hypothetical protein M1822_006238 [Bathelium mastoideum]